MTRYFAVPLADQGFVPVSETNRVRWYVERVGRACRASGCACEELHEGLDCLCCGGTHDRPWPLLGPYASMEAADFAAGELNRESEVKS